MQLPFMGTTAVDDFYKGTRAAVAGATTTISIVFSQKLFKKILNFKFLFQSILLYPKKVNHY